MDQADLVIADPPWSYQNWSDTSRGAAAAWYPVLGGSELKSLAELLRELVKPDAVLLLWATWPKLDQAFGVLAGWGFSHVTGFPWVKVTPSSGTVRRGVGFWAQSASELVLVGRRGNPKRQRVRPNVIGLLCGADRQFYDRIQNHSRKPYGLHEWAEEMIPGGSFLELFATEKREGWRCLGHRLGHHITPQGVLSLEEAKRRLLLPWDFDPGGEPVRKGERRRNSAAHPPRLEPRRIDLGGIPLLLSE